MKRILFSSPRLSRLLLGAAVLFPLGIIPSACSGSLADDSDLIPEPAPEAPLDIASDSILRFPVIADLESVTAADLPGDFLGYEISELSYECVDTVQLRALRFDVTARLVSPSGSTATITFPAEVGPQLVSVEYYPEGIIIDAHDNMVNCFYARVDRYRNYSDGSRIGPDEFYDFGHPFHTFMGDGLASGANFDGSAVINYDLIPWTLPGSTTINPERQYSQNGVNYEHTAAEMLFNLNTSVILEDGRRYYGKDLLPIHLNLINPWNRFESDNWQGMLNSEARFSSRLFNDPEGVLSMCSDVPDVSPKPFPADTKSRDVGFYFDSFSENYYYFRPLQSNACYEDGVPFISLGYMSTSTHVCYPFLIIDGRIIHYNQFFEDSKDYTHPRIMQVRATNTSDGYLYKFESDHRIWSARVHHTHDYYIRTYYGPYTLIDHSGGSWAVPNSAPSAVASPVSRGEAESTDCIPRPDGEYLKIDRRLPSSIQSVQRSRTINNSSR
ncbi:MAG: hypothetical protein K2M04_05470 [Muribaculaceae bacterium]|nr:hypothetical protein [Muribaculaceae bacterium]